ncbi:MAG: hypothetical protein AB1898_15925 [Acidobacteriota bacterium]
MEGVALIFIGLLVLTVTIIDPISTVAASVYIASSLVLLISAVVSLFTGYKVSFLPFKLCPFIFLVSAALILAGGLQQGRGI